MSLLNRLTLAQLKENKKRTFLTGLTISMIVALLTAIAIFLSSFWVFTYNNVVAERGEWHFRTNVISQAQHKELQHAQFYNSSVAIPADNTYQFVDDTQTKQTVRSYYYQESQQKYYLSLFSLVRGRLPQHPNEILFGNADYVGKTITLEKNGVKTEFSVVGYGYFRNSNSDLPVSYAVMHESLATTTDAVVLGTFKNVITENLNALTEYSNGTQNHVIFEDTNSLLMSLFFVSDEADTSFSALKVLVFIVITIVAIISIIVISSGFTLSLNERLKQLGVLSSIGTTRRQIRTMMLLESFWIGITSIVIGLVIGFIGISVAILAMRPLMKEAFFESYHTDLPIVIYPPALIAVVSLVVIIIVLSALWPSIRASHRAPIDNIKQVPFKSFLTFKKNRGVKSGRKPFGIIPYLVKRYTKHNRSRSRIVFTLLTVSLITFNVLANVLMSTQSAVGSVAVLDFEKSMMESNDVVLVNMSDNVTVKGEDMQADILKNPDVSSAYVEWSSHQIANKEYQPGTNDNNMSLALVILSDAQEKQLLEKAGVSPETFKEKAILVSYHTTTRNADNKIVASEVSTEHTLKDDTITLLAFDTANSNPNALGKPIHVPIATNIHGINLPFSLSNAESLVVSQHYFDTVLKPALNRNMDMLKVAITFKDKSKIIDTVDNLKTTYPEFFVTNAYNMKKAIVSILAIVQIIIYGFLGLVSIICVTTLFNTLTSHVRLRQREFAVLRSMGMTLKQLRLLLSIENMKTGILSIIIANVLSYVITYSIFTTQINNIVKRAFHYPLLPTFISSGTLLVILILFNLTTQRSIVNRSIVEDIRQETL